MRKVGERERIATSLLGRDHDWKLVLSVAKRTTVIFICFGSKTIRWVVQEWVLFFFITYFSHVHASQGLGHYMQTMSMALRWGTETVTFLRHSGWKFYQLKIPDARMVSEAKGVGRDFGFYFISTDMYTRDYEGLLMYIYYFQYDCLLLL